MFLTTARLLFVNHRLCGFTRISMFHVYKNTCLCFFFFFFHKRWLGFAESHGCNSHFSHVLGLFAFMKGSWHFGKVSLQITALGRAVLLDSRIRPCVKGRTTAPITGRDIWVLHAVCSSCAAWRGRRFVCFWICFLPFFFSLSDCWNDHISASCARTH